MTAEEARRAGEGDVEVHRLDLSHSDRARADGHAEGGIIIVTVDRVVVGAHILAPSAGEMIHELALAIHRGMKLSELASLIHVYPTLSTSVGQLAAEAAFAGARRWAWTVRAGRLWDRLRRN
jgi:pyruvate/2-oxoglutarate dehydrogenase complex dihydrolipoamide dehydrogenase (E3) component